MPTTTYVALQTFTLSSTASEVTFSDLPQTYRDYVLVMDLVASGTFFPALRVNGDSSSLYSEVGAFGTLAQGAGSYSGSGSTWGLGYNNVGSGDRVQIILQFQDVNQTNKHKTVLMRYGQLNNVIMYTGRYASTNVLSSLRFYTVVGSFGIGSTFSLYGIEG